MIAEGIVALLWAAAAAYFFGPNGPVDTTGKGGPAMVGVIANEWFPKSIAAITVLGVISAAVTSGDTALRSARLIVADSLGIDQKPMRNRLLVALPVFAVTAGILVYSLVDTTGFDVIWRYFAWSNQVLATVTLWTATVYLSLKKKPYIIALIPAIFMTMVTSSFLFVAEKEGLGSFIPRWAGYTIGAVITCIAMYVFFRFKMRSK